MAGGAKGPGQVGQAGPRGPAGPAGPTGPTGVIKVLGFEGKFDPASLPGNGGNTIANPLVCRTASYTAGTGEIAVIALSATASPAQVTTDVLYINAMAAMNGGSLQRVNGVTAADSLTNGTAHPTINLRYPSRSESPTSSTIDPAWCQGVVTIVRT